MDTRLAPHVDEPTYWHTVYRQDGSFWQPALDLIRDRHDLPHGTWQRFALGKNAVFALGDLVIKLAPPFWAEDLEWEVAALGFVGGRLPVATPQVIATGALDGWSYLVQTRLPGELMRSVWRTLDRAQQAALAYQHGELMAALHTVPIDDAPELLRFNWPRMIDGQRAECERHMRKAGVPDPLLADLQPYLAAANLDMDAPHALLHGDLQEINMVVVEERGQRRIAGLLDWGDVKIGPIGHEFISPAVHMYRGDPLMAHWYDGYGLPVDQRTVAFERNVMARSLLYYAEDWAYLLDQIPDARACRSWDDVAACLWRMR